jgi:hypothetical protein
VDNVVADGTEFSQPGFREKITGMIELRCSRDLAVRLGAFWPETTRHHRELRDGGEHMVVRDRETSWPMFWKWQMSRADMAAARSS